MPEIPDAATATSHARTVPTRWRDPLTPPAWAKRLAWYHRGKLRPDHPFLRVLQDALLQGDPLADDAVAWMETMGPGEGRKLFELALERGIDALGAEAPAALVKLFAQLDAVPSWVDAAQLRYACESIQRAGVMNDYALGCGSLMSGYLSSAAVKPLMTTGALAYNAARRVVETGKFVLDITESGNMGRHTAGFKTAVRVRLLHAIVRAKLQRSPDWKTEEWGSPINQNDLLGTNLQFSVTYLLALRMLGFWHSRREREAIMHFWRYVGYLMGIDERLLPKTYREGTRYLRLLGTSQPDPDDDSRTLAAALVNLPLSLSQVTEAAKRRAQIVCSLRAGISRAFMGGTAADALGLPNDRWKYAVLLIAPPVSALELAQRIVPGVRSVAVHIGRRFLQAQIRHGLTETAARRMHV